MQYCSRLPEWKQRCRSNFRAAASILLRVSEVAIAGFDGYDSGNDKKFNYATEAMELLSLRTDPDKMNTELKEMLTDFNRTRNHKEMTIRFITQSRFETCFQEDR